MNRLSKEKSPYLLQHAQNPVYWWAWNPEAFAAAKQEDKPILLSIGYSTCHWCHVMEHESFEDTKTAELMNENFICIKVDREERPDIDHIYMQYVTETTGSGGWPMTVFLTPEKKPFYGGTYFPPEDRYGMPGFKSLLTQLKDAWKTRRDEIIRSADSATDYLKNRSHADLSLRSSEEAGKSRPKVSQHAFEQLEARFDAQHGGFGRAPKFPMGHNLSFLLRFAKISKNQRSAEMALETLTQMACGGIYDWLGGGFHRYSTDNRWRIPHFEKMLYDQAILAAVYCEAFQYSGNRFFSSVAEGIFDYVLKELTSPEGGFYSAEDADSLEPGSISKKREGAFYVWTQKEISEYLPQNFAPDFCMAFGIEEKGNALTDPHREFEGQNVLCAKGDAFGEKMPPKMRDAKALLLKARAKRPRPHLDDKVLADWNGLMITALAQGSAILKNKKYYDAAEKAGEFIWQVLRKETLLHRYRDHDAAVEAGLEDYAFLAEGFLALYEAGFEKKWLDRSRTLVREMVDLFWDEKDGGFFMTSKNAETLIFRPKDAYDGAVYSGNSAAAWVLVKLSRFDGGEELEGFARKTIDAFSASLESNPASHTKMLAALQLIEEGSVEMALFGESKDPQLCLIKDAIYSKFIPNKVLVFKEAPSFKVQLCRNKTCGLPITSVAEFKRELETL